MRILVAEDDRECRELLRACLDASGYEVVCVEDGAQAWDVVQRDPGLSLLITSWNIPGVDGMELCRRVRGAERARYLPVIMLPERSDQHDPVAGLNAGADAFVAKPVDGAEVLAQIRVAERIVRLQERLEAQLEDLAEAHSRLERNLRAAANVQRSLLPADLPRIQGLEFAWVYEACELVGGDMFNVVRLDENHIGMYVLDVSGHGTSAALLSVSLSRVLTPFTQQGGILKRSLPKAPYYELVPPREVASDLNRRFQLIQQSGQFFTFLYGILDLRSREFRHVRAGHPALVHASRSGAELLDRGGDLPIGITEDATYSDEAVRLESGDLLLLYTDGVSEARSQDQEEFGTARMLDILGACREARSGIASGVQSLCKSVEAFSASARPRDDITVVGVEVV